MCEHLKPAIENATSDEQAFNILQNVIVSLHDAHSLILPTSNVVMGAGIDIVALKGDAIVVKNSNPQSLIAVGDSVISLDGKNPAEYHVPRVLLNRPDYAMVTEIAQAVTFYTPDSPANDAVEVKVRRASDNSEHAETVRFQQINPASAESTQLSIEGSGTVAVWRINTFSGQAQKETLLHDLGLIRSKLSKLHQLVIDLRKNGGGSTNIGYPLLKLLIGADTFNQMSIYWQFRCNPDLKPVINPGSGADLYTQGCDFSNDGRLSKLVAVRLSDYGSDPDFDTHVDPRLENIDLKILIGPESYSTTESFSRVLQLTHRATIIGRPTGGGGMAPKLNFTLPKTGLNVMLSAVNFLYDEGSNQRSLEGVGVIPDMECKPTYSDVIGNTDTCLDNAKKPR
jgi:C-terminal processing protease CtpA/Prc